MSDFRSLLIRIRHHRPRGIAVLFSLLIISLVTLIGLGISYIIIRELNLSENIDFGLKSYYAADSGIEKGLYRIKYGRENGQTLNTIVAALSAYTGNFSSVQATYTNEDSAATIGIEAETLEENQSVQADYTEANPTICGSGACVGSLVITWDDADPLNTAVNIEVTFIGWVPGASITVDAETQKIIRKTGGSDNDGEEVINHPDGAKLYRIRVKALGGDFKNLVVTAYDRDDPLGSGGQVVPSTSSITVKSKGTRNQFSQAISASVPWQPPLSGIFDYVVFSEEDLQKVNPIVTNPPIYRSGRIEIEGSLGAACSCLTTEPPACNTVAWDGGCDSGGSGLVESARCVEAGHPGTCSVAEANISSDPQLKNTAGFYVLPDLASRGFPSGTYYLRLEGETTTTPAASIWIDDESGGTPGADPYTEAQVFTPPQECRFNCLMPTPVKLGKFCSGGDNNGKACSSDVDCPSGVCGADWAKIYILGKHSTLAPTRTYLDWYSISSSPLLTGPADRYCPDFTASDCAP